MTERYLGEDIVFVSLQILLIYLTSQKPNNNSLTLRQTDFYNSFMQGGQ